MLVKDIQVNRMFEVRLDHCMEDNAGIQIKQGIK